MDTQTDAGGPDAYNGPRAASSTADTVPGGRRRSGALGLVSAVGAAGLGVVMGCAVAVATTDDYVFATVLAQVAVIGSIATLILGIGAVVTGRGRRWGVLGVVLSVLANPLSLTAILGFFDTFTTTS